MTDAPDHATPNSETIKLIIDKALLESEARTATTISTTLTDQNKVYMGEIVKITTDIAKLQLRVEGHEVKISGFKSLVATVASVTTVLGGFVGFFIAQLSNAGGK